MDILFDRCVKFIDEGQTRDQTTITYVRVYKAGLPPPRMCESEEAEDQKLSALDAAAIARHEAEVEADPALTILRESAVAAAAATSPTTTTTSRAWRRKEPVTLAATAGYYRKMLDGVEPVLPDQLAPAPAVNSVALRVSWLPRDFAATGFIASAHDNLLVLCVGSYHDDGAYRGYRSNLLGCYMVLDTRAKLVTVVPPLPDVWTAMVANAHYPIGSAGVAVLRTDDVHDDCGYLLAELYRHTDGYMGDYLSTNTATLFMWCSPGSSSGSGGGTSAAADQWIRKEVVLPPLPGPDDEDGYCFNFNPGTVFAVSNSSLCWVDVWAGILVCNNITSTAAATDDDDGLVFTFIPLPEGCAPGSIGNKTEYRSVCCVDSETIKLVCMDDDGEEVTLAVTTWTLKSPLSPDGWRWEKDEDASCSSLCVADLLDDAIDPLVGGGNKRRLLRRVALWPVVGRARPGVVHVSVHELEFKRKEKQWEATGMYEVSLDVPRRRVASSVFTFPAGSLSSRGEILMV